MSFLSPSEGSTWREPETDKDRLCSSHNSKRKRAAWPNINPAINCLHKHPYGVSTLCTLFQHCSDFECPAASSSNQAEQSTGVIHLKFAVLGMMVQHEKTDQTTETCANSTPETTNELLFFFFYISGRNVNAVLRQQIQTLSSHRCCLLCRVWHRLLTHISPYSQFASTKYHLHRKELMKKTR